MKQLTGRSWEHITNFMNTIQSVIDPITGYLNEAKVIVSKT